MPLVFRNRLDPFYDQPPQVFMPDAAALAFSGRAASLVYGPAVTRAPGAGVLTFTGRAPALSIGGGGGSPGSFSDDTLWWPDETRTGHLNEPNYPGSLTAGPGTISANTTYSYRSWTSSIPDIANKSNITFIGCLFQGYSPDLWLMHITGTSSNIKFYYCTFRPDAGTVGYRTYGSGQVYQYAIHADNSNPHSLTAVYCDFWGFGNAFQVNGSSLSLPHIFKHNYFHHAGDNNGSAHGSTGTYHHDGILCTVGGTNYTRVQIDHNSFRSYGNTNGIAMQLNNVTTGPPYSNMLYTRNLLSGWGYAVQLGGHSTTNNGQVFVDNVLSTELEGEHSTSLNVYDWTGTNRTWRRNKWLVPPGADFGNPADSGKFWGNSNGSPTSTDTTAEGTTFPYYCTAIRATPGSSQASVEFTAPSDNGGASISGYKVMAYLAANYREDYVAEVTNQTGSSSPIVVTGLTPGVSYVFTVAATNSVGYGPQSAPCGAVTIL